MRRTLEILRFELSQRLRRISTWVYFAVFVAMAVFFVLAAGGAIKGASVDFGTGGKVFVNSPSSLHFLQLLIGLFGTVMVASIAGQATYQDIDHRATGLFFTAPLRKHEYLLGRLGAALVICALILSGVGVGAAVTMQLPALDAARVGPGPGALAYVQPYLTVLLPNLFITVAIFFSVAVLTRRMLPVNAGAVVLLLGYLIASALSDDVENKTLLSLLDPFGMLASERLTEYWTVTERNAMRVPLDGVLLTNRLIWCGAAAALLAFTFLRFSFSRATGPGAARKEELAPDEVLPASLVLPVTELTFSRGATLRTLWKLTRLQWVETVKSVVFVMLLLAAVLLMASTAQSMGRMFGTATWPVTRSVLEVIGGPFQAFMLAVITFFSGELVWRERDAGLGQIHDALPTPGWVLFTSKWLALLGLIAVLLVLLGLSGVVIQILNGYHHHELWLYGRWLFGIRFFDLAYLATLGLLIHTVVNQKYAGHFAMVGYYVVILAMEPLGLEHPLYRSNSQPQWMYSDMNGFGHYAAAIVWFKLYWGSLAVAMAAASTLLWVRGVEGGWRHRLKLARERLGGASLAVLVLGLTAFVGVGAFLFWNMNVLNRYRTRFQTEALSAGYEKKYKADFAALAQPRVTAADVEIDLFPEERRLLARGAFTLENKTAVPIERIAVNLAERATVRKLSFGRDEKPEIEDPLGFRVYRLGTPLAPGEEATLVFELEFENRGIESGPGDRQVVHNGTFFNNLAYLPTLGYVEAAELEDDTTRRKHGLSPRPRMRELDDPKGLANNYVSGDADWIRFEATISTSPDQLALAPGYLEREWTENGRRYFHYAMDASILNFYAFISARYEVKRDAWKDVAIEIYHHPTHRFDLDRMVRAVKDSLEYFTREFGPYQHRQVRVIEFPRYSRFAQAFPNTIPFSEAIGFIARVDDSKDDEIDYPYYVTSHEVAHQWWAHQVIGGNVQGSTMLSESLAQYSAFMVMKQAYGERAMRKFLRYELDRYLSGRATERHKELPLLRVENQAYIHYAKGSLVLYALADAFGEATLNRAIRTFLESAKYQGPPYTNSAAFLAVLSTTLPSEAKPLLHDWLEKITLYELRATSATAKKLPDGRYSVTVKASAKKVHAGELGEETEAPLDQLIGFGALDAKGNAVALEKFRVDASTAEATFVSADLPAKAGIDPLNMLIDRKPDDNVVAVELQR